MMLATEALRVALATTHLPLRAIADAITPALLHDVIAILHHDLRTKFGLCNLIFWCAVLTRTRVKAAIWGRKR